ncbi:AAA family ATPase [Mycolicibacterium sp. P1-18]|uniref:MobF family relaxase n=1 Tax=Mycolicibacterium sp. P1-18 TaxID=2024615 RepID=UPI0011F2F7F2|nr:MobF family relaxase [Mycolicibacterium sp. P1-18]KAA0098185.1 AAA family ATPase [Mycolicibacterium sp. P1-18]
MLTISKLKRWSIAYYLDTAQSAQRATADFQRAGGGLGEYYSEHDTRTPKWLCAGDTRTSAGLVGLSDTQRAGGEAEAGVVARWLDDGVAPSGARGRALGAQGVHGYDLTFSAPKSVSVIRAVKADDVVSKGIADAHTTALAEAMEYLAAHAGYTRVHNPVTEQKDLVHLPGLVAVAYQHETSRCGDPHLHTHVIVPNRQARADGVLVSIDGTSLYHEAKAVGVIYQATLRRELHQSLGFEWEPVDPHTGMAELAGIDRASITAWSRRSSQLRDWAARHLTVVDAPLSPAQLAAAQKATRPSKPEELAWPDLLQQWRADGRGVRLDRASFDRARAARRAAARIPFDRGRLADAAEKIDKAAFTRADLVEIIGAQLPVDGERSPREAVEAAVDELGMRLTAPRQKHQREGHVRFTLSRILAEELAVLDLADARDDRTQLWVREEDTRGLSADQRAAVEAIGRSPWLVQPLSAPAGAGKTTSLRALRAAAHHRHDARVLVLAPTGRAVDVAVREGAGDQGLTIAKALQDLGNGTLSLDRGTVVVVDEAGMVGTDDLRQLLTATTTAGMKTVLVGDAFQLAPVKARGGMFAQLCADLPWTQHLSEVWRMRNPEERAASLALRNGELEAVRMAVDWYRDHDRLRCGDQIAMASDALDGYRRDVAVGKEALLLCDTTEMADALNRRIHDDTIPTDAPTVIAARGQRIAAGDLILSRRNDPTVDVRRADDHDAAADPVRNGDRWRVAAIDPGTNRIAAERLSDGAGAVFDADYVREHVTHGYATTVHTAQGVTADATHAVLGENTSRSMLYVAMTRARDANTAYLYERAIEQGDSPTTAGGPHVVKRGTNMQAGQLARAITTIRDDVPVTAHQVAAYTPRQLLPDRVAGLLGERKLAVLNRATAYSEWQKAVDGVAHGMAAAKVRDHAPASSQDRNVSRDDGIEL